MRSFLFLVSFFFFISGCATNNEVKRMLNLEKGYFQKDFLDKDCVTEGIHYQCVYELTSTGPGMKPTRSYLITDHHSNLYVVDKFDFTRKKYIGKYYVNKNGNLAIQVKSKKFSPILYLSIHQRYGGYIRYYFSGYMGKSHFSLIKVTPPPSFIQKKKIELREIENSRRKKLEQKRLHEERLRYMKNEEKRKERIRKNPCGLSIHSYANAQAKCRLDAQMYGSNYSTCYEKEIRKILRKQGCKR